MIAGEIYREMVEREQAEPGQAGDREHRIAIDRGLMRPNTLRKGAVYARFGGLLTEFLERRGILLSHDEQAALLQAVGEAVTQANEQLLRNAKGDYSPDPKADRFPEYVPPEKEQAAAQSLVSLYDLYVGQLGHAPGTIKRWRPKYAQFEEFVAPKAWHQATEQDVIAWMDELVNPKKFPDREPVKPITVRDVHFAAVRALYAFLAERDWGTTRSRACASACRNTRSRRATWTSQRTRPRSSCAPR